MKKPSFLSITAPADENYIKAADGLRALAIFGVMWYHIWQQSWLYPGMEICGVFIDLTWLVRCGYLLVDCMLMLSGFLLFLPYAKSALDGTKSPGILSFYKRRAARILPSYYLSVLIMFFFVALPSNAYHSTEHLLRDLIPHLTLTHVFFPEAYTYTHLNVVLWTISIEVQFYIIFPFVARAFKKYPLATYAGMVLLALLFRNLYAAKQADTTHLINQFPAMLDVYANGMLASFAYVSLARSIKENKAFSVLSTVIMALCAVGIYHLFNGQLHESGYPAIRLGQMSRRYPLSLLFALMLLFAGHALRPVQWILGNRLMRFLSAISFQAYIWHSMLALRLKAWRIPSYVSEVNPQMNNEPVWQIRYTYLCFFLAFALAVFLTYAFEKPLARLILKGERPKKNTEEINPPKDSQ